MGQHRGGHQGSRPEAVIHPSGDRERPIEEAPDVGLTHREPGVPHGGGDTQRGTAVAAVDGTHQSGADVGPIRAQPPRPSGLISKEPACCRLGEVDDPGGVRTLRRLGRTHFVEPLGQILAERLKQSVAGGDTIEGHQRLGDELVDAVEHVELAAAYRLHGVQPEPAREHRQSLSQPLLVVGEQFVAPVERHP